MKCIGYMPPAPRRRPERAPQYESAAYRSLTDRFTANLRREREARGWTQADAAERCDMVMQQYQRTEAGGTNLTFTTLARVVEGFGLDVGALFVPATPIPKRPPGRPRKVEDVFVVADQGWFVAAQERPPEDRPVGELIDPDLMPPKKPRRK
jgi:transcriptional regulator with XRE-family HTH domain